MAKTTQSKSECWELNRDGKQHYYLAVPDMVSFYLPSESWRVFQTTVRRILANDSHSLSFVCFQPARDQHRLLLSAGYLPSKQAAHLSELRHFFRFLYAQRDRLTFWLASSVTDSFFELMLCCQKIWFYQPTVFLGFPEWERGFPPLGGVCELSWHAGDLKKSFWQKNKIFRPWMASESTALGLEWIAEPVFYQWLKEQQMTPGTEAGLKTKSHSVGYPFPWISLLSGQKANKGGCVAKPEWLAAIFSQSPNMRPQKKIVHSFTEVSWDILWYRKDQENSHSDYDHCRDLLNVWSEVLHLGATPSSCDQGNSQLLFRHFGSESSLLLDHQD
ncbi:MAG: hypothetical protein OXC40_03115, partial [Proteobacteria bacterium]|nr:hypothetical protein [Pseudomonadota bacterium]